MDKLNINNVYMPIQHLELIANKSDEILKLLQTKMIESNLTVKEWSDITEIIITAKVACNNALKELQREAA